jgi:outer membrane protein assembly factor BamB
LPPALFAADWLTFGADPQRSGWARSERVLTKANAHELKLEWSLKLDNQAREMMALTVPVIKEQVVAPGGFRDVVLVAGSSDKVWAIDPDTKKIYWKREFENAEKPRSPANWLCPNSLNATPVIDPRKRVAYVITSDGKLRTLSLVTGEDRAPAQQFVPAYSKNWSLNLAGDVLYTATSQGCNGAKSAVYAMDLNAPDRPVTHFLATTTGGAGIWGRAGVAVGFNGRVFAETGDGPYDPAAGKWADTFLGLAPKAAGLADYYTPANRAWITRKDLDMGCISPVVFKYKSWELVAGGGKEGVLYLLDANKLGGDDHRTPLYRSALITNEQVDFAGRGFWGSFATWEDEAGTRWLYAPAWGPPASTAPKFPLSYGPTPNGSIMAFRILEKDGKPFPEAAWMSVNMTVPEPPVIANGVVLALSNGEYVEQVDEEGRLLPTEARARKSPSNAALYALDAATGKVLWSSGDQIKGWTHFSGLALANGRIYVVTHDSTLWCFSVEEK